MLDGNPLTVWHSKDKEGWARISFDKTQTVTKVGFIKRLGNCTLSLSIVQSRAGNFPCKSPKKVGQLRASWKIMSTLLNYTNFGINSGNQRVMTPFIQNIVVKNLLYTYATLFHYCSVQ